MLKLADIAVRVEGAGDGGLGAGAVALLNEIAALLERFAATGEAAAIDLRSLPMGPLDRAQLEAALGQGEVQATIEADGRSQVRETGVAGVWWLEHRDPRGEVVAELIEVTSVPEILGAAADDIGRAAHILRARVADGRGALPEEST